MKLYHHPLSFALLLLMLFTACDFDASRPEYDSQFGYYDGKCAVGLYTPDAGVEQSNLELTDNFLVSVDSLNSEFLIAADNEDWMALIFETADTIHFTFPFCERTGEVRTIFGDGPLAQLCEALAQAVTAGQCSADSVQTFMKMIGTIEETIYIPDLMLPSITTTELGNSIVSFDHEQNSFYVRFDLPQTRFTHHSSLSAALAYIWPVLKRLQLQNLIDETTMQQLLSCKDIPQEGWLTESMGYCTVYLANFHTSVEIHIEQAQPLLGQLATTLYGANTQGSACLPLWLTLYYEGDYDPQKNIDLME